MDLANIALRLSKLEEIEKIKELRRHHFPMAGDPEMDVEAAVSLFSDDAVIEYTGGIGGAMGKEQLRDFFTRDPVNSRFHLFVPGWIRVDDSLVTGTGHWHLLEMAKIPNSKTQRNEPVWIQAVYHDEYVRVNGDWKLKRYTCEIRMCCSHHEGWGETAVDAEAFLGSGWNQDAT